MPNATLWDVLSGIPKLIVGQLFHPLISKLRGPMKQPETQAELAALVIRPAHMKSARDIPTALSG